MYVPAPESALDPEVVAASRLHVVTHVLRLAGGDPALATQIREMLWADYCDADAPFGVSEDGMYVWWADALDAAVA